LQHPFSVLAPEYATLLAAMRVDPAREHELAMRAAAVLALAQAHSDEWAEVKARTGVPPLWGMASFERESGSDYSRSPAQGDRWNRVSVNVPRGLGPYACWGDACVAAYRLDGLDKVAGGAGIAPSSPPPSPTSPTSGGGSWTWTRACYEGELFNGFGPRAHGRRTGYLWSWTNIYDGGKYVADGKWDPHEIDQQCGMVPMMAALLRLDSSLALADKSPLPGVQVDGEGADAGRVLVQLPPAPAEVGGYDLGTVKWLQEALNRLGADPPLVVDGSYGRMTRRAVTVFQVAHGLEQDGIAGPVTLATLRHFIP
jgi:lysozyme family protein